MQPHSTSNNKIIAVFLVVILVGVGYYFFFIRSADDVSLDIGSLDVFQTAGQDGSPDVSTEILSLLQQINRLTIDARFFDRPDYRSLRDYPVVVPPQNVGRDNPFAPFRGSASSRTSTSTSNVVLSPIPR